MGGVCYIIPDGIHTTTWALHGFPPHDHHIALHVTPQAGTFEERSATPWAKERLTELLKAFSSGGVAVTVVSSITGDANIWMVRGKKRRVNGGRLGRGLFPSVNQWSGERRGE